MSNFPTQLDDDISLPRVDNNITEIGDTAINALRDAVFNIEEEIGIGASGTAGSIANRLSIALDPAGNIQPSAITGLGLVTLPITNAEISLTAAIQESKLQLDYSTAFLFNLVDNLNTNLNIALNFQNDFGYKIEPHIDGNAFNHYMAAIKVSPDSLYYLKDYNNVNRNNNNLYDLVKDINTDYNDHVNSRGDSTDVNTLPSAKGSIASISSISGNEVTLINLLNIKNIFVGKYITISGAATSANNGTFLISEVVNSSSIKIINPSGVAPDANNNSIQWEILSSSSFAHHASGINLYNTFTTIPSTVRDLQTFAKYIDETGIASIGSRIQVLYSNGIPKTSRAVSLKDISDEFINFSNKFGSEIVPTTNAITYLLKNNASNDDIDDGDDIIEFSPSNTSDHVFDSKFSKTKIGDIVSVYYPAVGDESAIITYFIIKEIKYVPTIGSKKYIVRIAGRNLRKSNSAKARIDKSPFNTNKYGSLAVSTTKTLNLSFPPSLIISNPRSAQILGIGFNADLLDSEHYNLYLALYPTGDVSTSVILPPIDLTGNQGKTPGKYTLESIVDNFNKKVREPGYNYRFVAFSYNGEFGIMLADSYNNVGFSIISADLNNSGEYVLSSYAYNAIDVINNIDPLGLGLNGANAASPPYQSSFPSAKNAFNATRIFLPLARYNFYTNGVELEKLNNAEKHQQIDDYGNGFWSAKITNVVNTGSRVKTTYKINYNLSQSNLQSGKTIVVQEDDAISGEVDFGRYVIENIYIDDCSCVDDYTEITVYDSVHGTGTSPYATAAVGTDVKIYFSSDSVSFNKENASDHLEANNDYKQYFEIYVDESGKTFAHERARLNYSQSDINISGITLYGSSSFIINKINIHKISPKLKGYSFSSTSNFNLNKINLVLLTFDSISGLFSGYLCKTGVFSSKGPTVYGKQGEVVRFYDETNIDYIDFIFNLSDTITTLSSSVNLDIQLFTTLSLDDEVMLLASCQLATNQITNLVDHRQFGNVSEKQLSTSALNYISAPTKLLNENGVIQGFDIISQSGDLIYINGGVALVNGKIVNVNNLKISPPILKEYVSLSYENPVINWFLCLNENGEFEFIASTDFQTTDSNYTGLDHKRLFKVKNPNDTSGLPYVIKSGYLRDLVLNKKDLVVLYLIETTVGSGPPYTISINGLGSDLRRYVYNGYGGFGTPFIVGKNGSFKNLKVVNNWLYQLLNYKSATEDDKNSISTKVIVRDYFDVENIKFEYNSKVIFEGDGSILNLINQASSKIFENVEFNNFIINISDNLSTISPPSFLVNDNVVFKSCIWNLNNDLTVTYSYTDHSVIFENNIFNLNSAYELELQGFINNNIFNYNNSGANILLQKQFQVKNNYFYNKNTVSIRQFLEVGYNIPDVTGNIIDNFFYRKDQALTIGYIKCNSNSGPVNVINNYFDMSTINGTSSVFVYTIKNTWKFINNINSASIENIKTLNSNYTITIYDSILYCDIGSGSFNITLPKISDNLIGRKIIIKNKTSNISNKITIKRSVNTDKIDGIAADFELQIAYGSITLISDGVDNWFTV